MRLFLLNNEIIFPMQEDTSQRKNLPIIGYKRRRTKGIICHGKRPSDIDSNLTLPDDDLEAREITQEEESMPKRRKTGGNKVNMPCG